jgi:hypothetical protein
MCAGAVHSQQIAVALRMLHKLGKLVPFEDHYQMLSVEGDALRP